MTDNKTVYDIYRYNYARPAFFNRRRETYKTINIFTRAYQYGPEKAQLFKLAKRIYTIVISQYNLPTLLPDAKLPSSLIWYSELPPNVTPGGYMNSDVWFIYEDLELYAERMVDLTMEDCARKLYKGRVCDFQYTQDLINIVRFCKREKLMVNHARKLLKLVNIAFEKRDSEIEKKINIILDKIGNTNLYIMHKLRSTHDIFVCKNE